MDRGAWQATVHGVAKSWIQLSDSTKAHEHNKGYVWVSTYTEKGYVCVYIYIYIYIYKTNKKIKHI